MIQNLIQAAQSYNSELNVSRLTEAFEFARDAHEGQLRKDGTPYITHPVAAAQILTEMHVDEDTLIACLLHDVPEDTSHTIADVEQRFGSEVAYLVEGITKISKVYYRHDMEKRQVESLKKLFIHSAKDPRTIIIKLADRLHNMRTLGSLPQEKQARIAKETLEIYVPIANLLGIWGLKDELEDCCFKSLCPKEYREIDELVQVSKIERNNLLDQSIHSVAAILHNVKDIVRIEGRQKTHYRIYKKMQKKNKSFHEIYDLIGIRIIVHDLVSCYEVLGKLHQEFRPKLGRLKDYIGNPKSNGYKSIHTTVFGVDGMLTEFQIRTQDMHLENEFGIAAHYFYKEEQRHHFQDKLKKKYSWVERILDMQRQAENNDQFLENLKLDMFEDRIFVFTPAGDVVDLPKGANAIDFAYQIHSNLAEKAVEARINGRTKQLTQELKNGDVVELETRDDAPGPRLHWHYEVKTSHARTKIRQFLREQSPVYIEEQARTFLDKKLKLFGMTGVKALSDEQKKLLQEHFFVNTWRSFLNYLGKGMIDVRDAIGVLFTQEELIGHATDPLSNAAYIKRSISDKVYRVKLSIFMKNRVGVLRDVCNELAKQNVNILQVHTEDREIPEESRLLITVEIQNAKHYQDVLKGLQSVPDLIKVKRIQNLAPKQQDSTDAHTAPVQ